MRIEIIAIGDEVLYGYTINKNAAYIAQELLKRGFLPEQHLVIADEKHSIQKAIKEALERRAFVIVTGGLGPTPDDCTRGYVAEIFKKKLIVYEDVLKTLKARFGPSVSTLYDQAHLPQGAQIFDNPIGTAFGFLLEDSALFDTGCVACLPGVPSEMREILPEVLDVLGKKAQVQKRLFVKILHFVKVIEPEINPLVQKLDKEYPNVLFGVYPHYGTLTLHLKTFAENSTQADKMLLPVIEKITQKYKDKLFEAETGEVVEALHRLFQKKNWRLATAESCTGGALAAKFVALSGASLYFQGGIIAYSNKVKEQELFVAPQMIEEKGAVSEEVVVSMAKGVQKKLDVDVALAVSGIFGPTGATSTKPVGTVCMAIAFFEHSYSWTEHFSGNRETIMQKTIQNILAMCYLRLKDYSI